MNTHNNSRPTAPARTRTPRAPQAGTSARCSRLLRSAIAPFTIAALLIAPAGASAHGGTSIAEGGGGGVQIAVQGADAAAGEVDLSTTLAGTGAGAGSRVVYWIRPAGRERAVRIGTDRDEGGTHHAEIPTAGRGSWRDWDVSAYVTLSTGRTLRVTNDKTQPPGPPERPTATTAAAPPSTPTSTSPAALPADDGVQVQDVSGQSDGAPGWVVPSLVGFVVLSVLAVVVGKRRRPDDDAE